jgi:hypothetical protein
MQRRDLLRLFGTGAAISLLDPPIFAMLREAQAQAGSASTLRTLTPAQNDIVVRLSDLLIPATDTPGAKDVRVNEFIDVVLTDWSHENEKQAFLDGLAGVDARSVTLYGKKFCDVTEGQQAAILAQMDEAYAVELQTHAFSPHWDQLDRSGAKPHFFSMLKQLTVYGYYTSEAGFTQELKEQILYGPYKGCVAMPSATEAAKS